MQGLEDGLDTEIPPVELTNVGGDRGAPPKVIGQEILTAFGKSAGKVAARKGLEHVIKEKTGVDAGGLLEKILK
jgi:hypothetical protein